MLTPTLYGKSVQIQALQERLEVEKAQHEADVKALENRYRKLEETALTLRTSLQAATDIVTNTSDTTDNTHYVGAKYKMYSTQVTALRNKYMGKSDWGNIIAKNIVDVRAAFLIGRGVQVVTRDGYEGKSKREMKFVRDFIQYNNLDEEVPQDWAVGSELEGKVLVRLEPDREREMIRVVYVPWGKYNYTITADEPNFYRYIKATYTGTDTRDDNVTVDVSFDLSEDEFVYRRFGGVVDDINNTPSKTAMVLRVIEDLDMELWDWRKINHLFSAPTPVVETEDVEAAKKVEREIEGKNWRLGKLLILANGKFDLVCYKGEGFTTLEKAIKADVQTIAGATGVPVHFLGHPELLSNRATAENLLENIELATSRERKIWIGLYEELFQKAIRMYNKYFRQNLDPMAVDARIPFTSSSNLKLVEKVYLPMYQAGAMSLQTLLSYISELDVEKEIERIKEDKDEIPTPGNSPGDGRGRNSGNGGQAVAGAGQVRR